MTNGIKRRPFPSTNADLYRSIAISSILNKILDYLLDSLATIVIINLVLNLIHQLCYVAQC